LEHLQRLRSGGPRKRVARSAEIPINSAKKIPDPLALASDALLLGSRPKNSQEAALGRRVMQGNRACSCSQGSWWRGFAAF
jgi:hypothetical protein